MDPYVSMVAVLGVGWLGGLVADGLRLPRVVCIILLGVGLAPALHPSIMNACDGVEGAVSPAGAIRSFSLLIALARGGLTMKVRELGTSAPALLALATVPYALELSSSAVAAWVLLPAESGVGALATGASPVVTALAASLWSPLSPSVVVPNMLAFLWRHKL